jgi:UDP-2,3-diacylglucosamine pyrophosphatase LpxH
MNARTQVSPTWDLKGEVEPSATIQSYYKSVLLPSEDVSDSLIHRPHRYRSVFVSDLHLGTASCRAHDFVQFLNHLQTEYLFLVGDIFDFWKMGIFHPMKLGKLLGAGVLRRSQLTVVQKLLRADRHGVKTVFVPGNHDETLRDFVGARLSNIMFLRDVVHETTDGRRFLVLHGDCFDGVIRQHRWLSILGTHAFEVVAKLSIRLDRWRKHARINRVLEYLGLESHWSLAHAIKNRADGRAYTESYSQAMLTYLFTRNAEIYARRQQRPTIPREPYYSGIICGHTHVPEVRHFSSPIDTETGEAIGPPTVTYLNTGHWTGRPQDETMIAAAGDDALQRPPCTAVVEELDGRVRAIRWVPGKGIVPLTQSDALERERHRDQLRA